MKKSRYQIDAPEKEAVVAEFSIDGCEEQFKMNGKKKKSKRDKHLVFNSPSVVDTDLAERTKGNQNIIELRTKASMDVTTQDTNLEPIRLNSEIVQNLRETEEVAMSSTSGILADLVQPKAEGSKEGSKKSKKMKEGRTGKVMKNKSAVDVNLPDVQKPTETALETETRKNRRTEEELIVKDSVNSLADSDNYSVEKVNKTKMAEKRKAKTDRTRVAVTATQLLSESLAKNRPTETGGEEEDVYDSPKKKRKLLRTADVEAIQKENDQVTGSFWLKPAMTNASIPRPNKNLFQRKMRCPVDGCLGRSTRMNRHLLDCHPELKASEREKLFENVTEDPCNFLGAVPAIPVVPVLKRKLRCPVNGCFGQTIRLRRHLINCHSELTPTERDELWDKVFHNPTEYLCTLSKDSTSESKESNRVVRPKKSSAGIPRPNFKVRSRRRKQNCLVAGCHGAVINMRRHLVDCHSDIADEHERLLEKLVEQRQEQRAAKREALKQRTKCMEPSANTDSVASEDEGS